MTTRALTVGGVVAGAAAAVGTDLATARLSEQVRFAAVGGGLVIAALIYPAARRRPHSGGAARREWVAVAATTAAGILAARRPLREQSAILAAGWASHAAFDLTHRRGATSRIPGWYPALCAGYDVTLAVLLLAKRRRPA